MAIHFTNLFFIFRGLLASDAVVTAPEDDDITNILNVYCCHLVKDIPGKASTEKLYRLSNVT